MRWVAAFAGDDGVRDVTGVVTGPVGVGDDGRGGRLGRWGLCMNGLDSSTSLGMTFGEGRE